MLDTPMPYILIGLVIYAIAYAVYSKYVDKRIWQSDPSRPTPAKQYFDGVEYFPISKYVLYGYQFKSVAALGPIVGPLIAVGFYGWLPALIWLIVGNFFIGWVQDYSAMMMSVRNDGRSMGPITYELLGNRARQLLLGYLIAYLIIITSVFAWVITTVFNQIPGTFIPILFILFTGVIFGHLVFRLKIDVLIATIVALVLVFAGIVLTVTFPQLRAPATNFLDDPRTFPLDVRTFPTQPGTYTVLFWLVVLAIIYYIGAVTPMPRFLLPTVYVGYLPAIIALILVIIAALATPFTGLKIAQAPVKNLWPTNPLENPQTGPLWPILFVTIACGAISGWHSLVSSGLTSKQLEFETDARPVGGGAMITEGIVGLSSVASVMILATYPLAAGAYVTGASTLTSALTGISRDAMNLFYAMFVAVMGMITSMLFVRVWRTVSAELFERNILGNRWVSPLVLILIMIFLAFTGSWVNLWLLFGGTNQLLAGLALLLVAVYLAKVKRPTWYVIYPGMFMAITTVAALLWEAYTYTAYLLANRPIGVQAAVQAKFGAGVVTVSNMVSAALGIILAIMGALMTYYLFRGYFKYRTAAKA
ncbi:carbon starvation protein CstA [Desulfurococcaceae archaeon AG1]|nr:MAG: carbon starvation protein A [Desulfurococcaceae archaeon]GAY26393.1 carbon starvation protein CstA [Desulfurococcaceae archaeon AG1]